MNWTKLDPKFGNKLITDMRAPTSTWPNITKNMKLSIGQQ